MSNTTLYLVILEHRFRSYRCKIRLTKELERNNFFVLFTKASDRILSCLLDVHLSHFYCCKVVFVLNQLSLL